MKCSNCNYLAKLADGSFYCNYHNAFISSILLDDNIPCPSEEEEK